MIHLEGDRPFPLPPQDLFPKLTDLGFLVRCLPDVAEVKDVQPATASLVIRPGLAFVRGDLNLIIEKVEESPPATARLLLRTKGIGSTSTVAAGFRLDPAEGGTLLHWTADVQELGGLLKAVPKGFIQGAAQKVITDVLTAIAGKLG